MLMWYIIFVLLIASTVCGLLYLGNHISKFSLIAKLGRGKEWRSWLAGFAIVAAVFGLLAWGLNLMNAVVCLLHFVCIWLLCDLVFAVIKRIRKKDFAHYYAGTAAVVLSLGTLLAGWYLDHHVSAVFYTIETEKDVPELRIIQFADSHIGTTFSGKDFAKHVAAMQAHNPDAVVIVGDFVDDGTTRAEMEAATAALKQFVTPQGVYFVFGNHDKGYHNPALRGFTGSDLVRELKANNVTVLQDENVLLQNAFYIIGRNDSSEFMRGGRRESMQQLTKDLDRSKFAVVLDHQPNDYQNQAQSGVDLVLSGHTHGGQLFPLNKVGEWIGANDRTYGHERRGLTDFIVTSGISDWALKFKTGTKSEFVVIDIKKKAK